MKSVLALLVLGSIFFISCGDDSIVEPSNPNLVDESDANFELRLSLMKYLGSDFVYEGWLVSEVDNSVSSIGTFSIARINQANTRSYFFNVDEIDLSNAASFFISIEPKENLDNIPSNTIILRGDFNQDTASLDISSIADFNSNEISGSFFLRTPTDEYEGVGNNNGNDEFGVWFGIPNGNMPMPSLNLPPLNENDGWVYEGWALSGTSLITTGKFFNFNTRDNNAGTVLSFGADKSIGPQIPGEDFFIKTSAAPTDVSFPVDVRNSTIFVSIEPYPDNDEMEFFTGCLIGQALSNQFDVAIPMRQDLDFSPSGFAIKK